MKNQEIPPITELISSEIDYLVHLHHIVNGYLREYRNRNGNIISTPRNLRNCENYIFANIEDIYQWHRDYFLKSLINHQHDPSELAYIFIQNEKRFQMYAKFCKNKNMSEYLVRKHSRYFRKTKKKLGINLELNDLFTKPIERLSSYKSLISQICVYLNRENLLEDAKQMEEAKNMIETFYNKINDYAAVHSIQNVRADHGKLLHCGFLICENYTKKCVHYAFLFEKLIMFTHRQEAATQFSYPTYTICLQVPLNRIQMYELPDSRFYLCSSCSYCQEFNLVCYADDPEFHQKWLEILRKQLLVQQKSKIESLDDLKENNLHRNRSSSIIAKLCKLIDNEL